MTIAAPLRTPSFLTVNDVERLAKAGVKVDYENIKNVVVPDPPKPDIIYGQIDPYGWLRALHDRWQRTNPNPARDGFMDPHNFAYVGAVHVEDTETMHLMVATKQGRVAYVTDDAKMYPSDALIAKLHLLVKTEAA